MKDVSICFFFPSFEQSALALEVVAIVVIFKEVLIFLGNECTVFGVFDEDGHDCQDVDALEVQVISSFQLELMVQTQGDSFDLKVFVEEDKLLILFVALKHDNVIDISSCLYISFVKLEARIQIAPFGDRIYLLDGVLSLVVALAILDPVQEHGMMELDDRRWHQYVYGRVYNLFGIIVKVTLEEIAYLSNDHLLFVTLGMDKTGILFEKHNGIAQLLLLCCLVHEVIASFEDGVILNTIAKVLNHGWLYFFVFDENGKAYVVKFPPSIDVEEVTYLTPLC